MDNIILPQRNENSHKGSFGKVLNFAGSQNFVGAAYLSSISALRVGAGYVALASLPNVLRALESRTPDIVFIPVKQAKSALNKYDVVSLGCGLSTDAQAILIFKSIMTELSILDKPVILDADGINLLSKFKRMILPDKLILTPHPKEASRLLDKSVDEVLNNPIESAKEISLTFKCITVLKLHNTVVCSRDLSVYVNNTGNSALAKAGTGDVLCGMIAGLIAQKMGYFDACKTAVYLHGLAGQLASDELTEYSVLASDLLNYIPSAIKNLINNN
ncbi:NAD(P)H-hydrate dehydratase [bacterium]|nr:NAD(P)H-hydrate dehydratase [bacterium]